MRKCLSIIFLFFAVFSIKAQTIKITGTRFPYAIMQQWINAYAKTHPEIKFVLSKSVPADSAGLTIAAHAFITGELKANETTIAVNRYAQLPIVNSRRTDLKALQDKGFTQHDLSQIFFAAKENTTGAAHQLYTIYRRDKNVCASRSFAENITGARQDISGTLVTGDDHALSAAVKNDLTGISYNNLGFVYNLQTRKTADSIAIIPIDINENGKIDDGEKRYASLDEIIDFINATHTKKIPQDNVNIVFNKTTISKPALEFLQWIITSGQQYNRQYGFLDLDKSTVAQQQHSLDEYISIAKAQ